jgi:RNA polymerase sigma-70 factor (ECF subfamily)
MEITLAQGAMLTRESRSAETAGTGEEELLVRRAAAGDERAYGRLVQLYQSRLFNFVRSMVRNDELAEDITQEAFVKAFFNLKRLQNPGSFKSWLFRIANNGTLDYLRRKKFQLVDVDEQIHESYVDERDPERGALEYERLVHVRKALDRLKPEQKAILVMCDLQGLSYADIAAVLRVPFGTVQSRIFYARKKLKEHLDVAIIFGGES